MPKMSVAYFKTQVTSIEFSCEEPLCLFLKRLLSNCTDYISTHVSVEIPYYLVRPVLDPVCLVSLLVMISMIGQSNVKSNTLLN